jgi:hypothetical protein
MLTLSTSGDVTCGVNITAAVKCWGSAVYLFLPGAPVVDWVDSAVAAPAGRALRTILTVGGLGVCGFDVLQDRYCIGMNSYGELGDGTREPLWDWTLMPQPRGRFKSLSMDLYRSAALDENGQLFIWGKPGWMDSASSAEPRPVLPHIRWTRFDTEYMSYCGVTTAGEFGCIEDWDQNGTPTVTFYASTGPE